MDRITNGYLKREAFLLMIFHAVISKGGGVGSQNRFIAVFTSTQGECYYSLTCLALLLPFLLSFHSTDLWQMMIWLLTLWNCWAKGLISRFTFFSALELNGLKKLHKGEFKLGICFLHLSFENEYILSLAFLLSCLRYVALLFNAQFHFFLF